MASLGMTGARSALVWMIHCSKTRVTDAQLAEFSRIGAAIAPEKVTLYARKVFRGASATLQGKFALQDVKSSHISTSLPASSNGPVPESVTLDGPVLPCAGAAGVADFCGGVRQADQPTLLEDGAPLHGQAEHGAQQQRAGAGQPPAAARPRRRAGGLPLHLPQ